MCACVHARAAAPRAAATRHTRHGCHSRHSNNSTSLGHTASGNAHARTFRRNNHAHSAWVASCHDTGYCYDINARQSHKGASWPKRSMHACTALCCKHAANAHVQRARAPSAGRACARSTRACACSVYKHTHACNVCTHMQCVLMRVCVHVCAHACVCTRDHRACALHVCTPSVVLREKQLTRACARGRAHHTPHVHAHV